MAHRYANGDVYSQYATLQGGFLSGLIIPKKNGYAISLVEKLEDLLSILLLPLVSALARSELGFKLTQDASTSLGPASVPTWVC